MVVMKKKRKIIILVFYSVFCLIGLPLIFIFPPRKFLFKDDSADDADRMFVFKNFVSEIHDNINKNLIQNMTYTKENEECPSDFETLVVKHQYYGNFTHLFGNSSFCIKRYNNSEWNLKRILERNEQSCISNQKPCGIANIYSKSLLCINKDETCPFNNFSYATKQNEPCYKIADSSYYFAPEYNENNEGILIVDIDLVYKYRICLEKFHKFEKLKCEFADDDQCFIEDSVTEFTIEGAIKRPNSDTCRPWKELFWRRDSYISQGRHKRRYNPWSTSHLFHPFSHLRQTTDKRRHYSHDSSWYKWCQNNQIR